MKELKCSNCGATKFKAIYDGKECLYCGSVFEVSNNDSKPQIVKRDTNISKDKIWADIKNKNYSIDALRKEANKALTIGIVFFWVYYIPLIVGIVKYVNKRKEIKQIEAEISYLKSQL
jgi:uncharacterized Zn finger protein (UPF0148 family)